MPKWRNWQTRTFEGRVRQLVGVRVPPSAPYFSNFSPQYYNRHSLYLQSYHSTSDGLLKSTVSLTLPCPNCGNEKTLRFPGSRLDAVSSGGKITKDLRNSSTLF